MIDPGTASLAGAGISSLASLGGGLISSNFLKSSSKAERRFSREVAQNAVQWRVEDAKKAGIHPLFALGAQVATQGGSGTFIGDPLGPSLAEAGQNISNALVRGSERLDPAEKQRQQLDLALGVKAMQKTDAEIDLLKAQSQALNSPGSPPGITQENSSEFFGPQPFAGMQQIKPAEVTSHKLGFPSVEAGLKPGESEEHMPFGPMVVPKLQGESYYEMKESMNPIDYLAMVQRNVEMYGWDWLYNFTRYHMGQKPDRFVPSLLDQGRMGSYRIQPREWMASKWNDASSRVWQEIRKGQKFGPRYKPRKRGGER